MNCNSSGTPQPSGLIEEASLHALKISTSRQYDSRWAAAELRIAELLSRIQPNRESELRRKAVADYVKGLIHKCLDCQVFKFGSVPLKTYLPDGDIDLTAFSRHQDLKDTWAAVVQTVLKHEEQRTDAAFSVREVQYIHAEVKIVKCLVEDIVVDISFNQLGGLCTLCFLEEVDRLIQKNHLFKRSIILVKAWCYYESRLLGAHHGLISTYALETLVLYIFNVFHTTLRGPLEVLFMFLDYFSNFDWEKYCVSLWGPVPLALIHDLTAEPPIKDGGKMLLSRDFLEDCSARYDVFPKGHDVQARSFSEKFLNVVDPLRTNNNLGRSVSKANYFRIRSAFNLGARKLARVFEASDEDFPKLLDDFFSNTWERHQNGQRPDAPDSKFPPYKIFVYKAGCVNTHNENSPVNVLVQDNCNGRSLSDTLQTVWHSTNEHILRENENPRSLCSEIPSVEQTNNNPDEDPVKKASPSRTSSFGDSLNLVKTEGSYDYIPHMRRTASEGKLQKLLYAETLKDISLSGGPMNSRTQEGDPKVEIQKATGKWLPGILGRSNSNMTSMRKFSDTLNVQSRGFSGSYRGKVVKDKLNPDRSGLTRGNGVEGPSTTTVGSSRKNKNLTSSIPVMQNPPDIVFPIQFDQVHTPYGYPRYPASSPAAHLFSPFPPFVTPMHTLGLSTRKGSTTVADSRASAPVIPLTPHLMIPGNPVPLSISSYVGVQSIPGQSPLLNNPDTLQRQFNSLNTNEMEHQFPFLQSHKQEVAGFKPIPTLSCTNTSSKFEISSSEAFDMENCDVNLGPIVCQEVPDVVHQNVSETNMNNKSMLLPEQMNHEDNAEVKVPRIVSKAPVAVPRVENDTDESTSSSHPFSLQAAFADCTELTLKTIQEKSISQAHELSNQPDPDSDILVSSIMGPVQQSGVPLLDTPITGGAIPGMAVGNEDVPTTAYFPAGPFPPVPFYNPFYSGNQRTDPGLEAKQVKDSSLYGSQEDDVSRIMHSAVLDSNNGFYDLGDQLNSSDYTLCGHLNTSSEPLTKDLLSSDLVNHLQNLEFGRWCQEPVVEPVFFVPSIYQASNYIGTPFIWDCPPFRPLHGVADPFSHGVQATASMLNFGRMPNVLPEHNVIDFINSQKHTTGTGTFLPLRKNMSRDTQVSVHDQVRLGGTGTARQKNNVGSFVNLDCNSQVLSDTSIISSSGEGKQGVWRKSNSCAFPGSPSILGSLQPVHNTSSSSAKVFGYPMHEHCSDTSIPVSNKAGSARLEFGSLGPIEVMTSSGEINLVQEPSSLSGRPTINFSSTDAFSSFSDRELRQTVTNNRQRARQRSNKKEEDAFPTPTEASRDQMI